jgi:hypothetical protein
MRQDDGGAKPSRVQPVSQPFDVDVAVENGEQDAQRRAKEQ